MILLVTTFCMLWQVNCIVFDKTGTLTVGKPVVVNTRLFKNLVLKELLELVAAAEVCSISLVRIRQWLLYYCCQDFIDL